MLRLLACGLLAAAATAATLQECSHFKLQHTLTADLLKAGLFGFAALSLLPMVAHPGTLTLVAALLATAVAAATLVLPAAELCWTGEDRHRVWRDTMVGEVSRRGRGMPWSPSSFPALDSSAPLMVPLSCSTCFVTTWCALPTGSAPRRCRLRCTCCLRRPSQWRELPTCWHPRWVGAATGSLPEPVSVHLHFPPHPLPHSSSPSTPIHCPAPAPAVPRLPSTMFWGTSTEHRPCTYGCRWAVRS